MKDIETLYSKKFRLETLLNQANQNGYQDVAERYQKELEKTDALIDAYNKLVYGGMAVC